MSLPPLPDSLADPILLHAWVVIQSARQAMFELDGSIQLLRETSRQHRLISQQSNYFCPWIGPLPPPL